MMSTPPQIHRYLMVMLILAVFLVLFSYSLKYSVGSKNKITCRECNVVLISLDTVRADHLGTYGYFRDTSPNIDALSEKSVLFENAFSQSSHTMPSHMSLFTSLYPSSHKMMYKDVLDPKVETLAQVLRADGYATVWVAPLNDYNLDLNRGFGRGFDHFISPNQNQTQYWQNGLEWIEDNKNRKFFMFFHTYKAHDPYTPSLETVLRFTNKTDEKIISSGTELLDIAYSKIISNASIVFKDSFIRENEYIFTNKSLLRELLPSLCGNYSNLHRTCFDVYKRTFWENVDVYSDSDMDYVELLYDSRIRELDADVGRLFSVLEKQGLMNKTLLIITSDHGEEFMEHGHIDHGDTLYDEVIHVPLILWIPGSGRKQISSLVQTIDIMPTILELVGVDIPEQVQGKSLISLIEGSVVPLNHYVYPEAYVYLSAVRSGDWKYITDFRGRGWEDIHRRDQGDKQGQEGRVGMVPV